MLNPMPTAMITLHALHQNTFNIIFELLSLNLSSFNESPSEGFNDEAGHRVVISVYRRA